MNVSPTPSLYYRTSDVFCFEHNAKHVVKVEYVSPKFKQILVFYRRNSHSTSFTTLTHNKVFLPREMTIKLESIILFCWCVKTLFLEEKPDSPGKGHLLSPAHSSRRQQWIRFAASVQTMPEPPALETGNISETWSLPLRNSLAHQG